MNLKNFSTVLVVLGFFMGLIFFLTEIYHWKKEKNFRQIVAKVLAVSSSLVALFVVNFSLFRPICEKIFLTIAFILVIISAFIYKDVKRGK